MSELPDPDWYLDHVLIHAEPGVGGQIVVTAAAQWQGWWRSQLAAVRRDHPELVRLAATQGFAVTTRQLAEHGVSRHAMRMYIRDGHWLAAQPGIVSLIGPTALAHNDRWVEQRRRHAVLSAAAALANPGHAVSGSSAAVLHGLPTRHVPQRVELTSAALANPRRGARAATLNPVDVGSWFGVRVTVSARTCVDLARHDRRAGLMACDSALHQRLVSVDDLEAVLARVHRWPGSRQAREIVRFADARAESPLESVVRLALHDSGFPPPELQYEIAVPGRRYPLRVDLCWPQHCLILEVDGRTKYVGDENWREKKREALLRPTGFRIERVIWSDVEQTWAATSAYLWSALGLSGSLP